MQVARARQLIHNYFRAEKAYFEPLVEGLIGSKYIPAIPYNETFQKEFGWEPSVSGSLPVVEMFRA